MKLSFNFNEKAHKFSNFQIKDDLTKKQEKKPIQDTMSSIEYLKETLCNLEPSLQRYDKNVVGTELHGNQSFYVVKNIKLYAILNL